MDKNQLETKITNIITEIFALEDSDRNTSNGEFSTLRTKLADYVWQWASLVFSTNRLANAGTEIMECVNRSIKAFEGESEDYIKYISASLKQEIGRANEKNAVFEARIIDLPEQKHRRTKQILRYVDEYGKDILKLETQQELAEIFGFETSEIAKLITLDYQLQVQSETIISSEGDEVSLLDCALIFKASRYKTPEDEVISQLEQNENFSKVLNEIDEEFCKSQERTKPYLSALLMLQILSELKNAKIDSKQVADLLKNRAFAQTEKAQNILERFLSDDELPKQEEVAKMFGRDKTDASRAIRKFLEKINQEVSTHI